MPLFRSNQISKRYLSFAEREEIGLLRAQYVGVREIASRLGRSPSTVSRELTRNAATRCGRLEYRASVAQWKAELVAKRPKPAKLATNPRLHTYVQDPLEAKVHDADGCEIAGPRHAPFKGRNKPHHSDRKWVNGWSPEQISNRQQIDFPDDESPLLDRGLYVWSVMLSGFQDLNSTCAESLFGEKGMCRMFTQQFNLTYRDWETRRTSRSLGEAKINEQQRERLREAVDFIATRLAFQSSVQVRGLGDAELCLVNSTLASQVSVGSSGYGVGFFHAPSTHVSVRENWVMIGVAAQLMCVFGNKISCKVFLSHGLEQSKYPDSLRGIEYVLLFGGS